MISFHADMRSDEKRSGGGWAATDEDADLVQLANYIADFPWSGCIWNGGRRKSELFISGHYLVLDFDDGMMTIAQAQRLWADHIYVIGTTKSHQKEKNGRPPCDRFRLVVPFSAPITCARTFVHTTNYYIERHGADGQCKDAARWYWPCTNIVDVSFEGDTLDAIEPAPIPPPQPPSDIQIAERACKAVPGWARHALRFGAAVGERNSTVFRIAAALQHNGFSEDEAVEVIARSAIDLPFDELTQAARNGWRNEKATGRRSQ